MMILNSLKTAMSFAGGGMTRATGTGTGNSGGLSGAGGKSQDPLPGLTLSDELVEDIKKNVETSQGLQRSMESARDGARRDKVARVQEKVAQLKERIRFASPQQAKALMKELKQLAKEFKGAAKELGSEAQSLASPAAAGSGLIQPDGSAMTAEMLAGEPLVNQTTSASQTDAARKTDPARTTDTEDAKGADAPDPQAERQQDLRKAVLSYVSEQVREEIMVAGSRAEAMKLERDEFEKIGKEIKFLAGQIDLLHKLGKGDGDDKIRRDRKGVLDALEDGIDTLNDPKVIRAIDGAIAARSALGTQPDATPEPATANVSPQLGSLAYSLQTTASLTVPAAGRVA